MAPSTLALEPVDDDGLEYAESLLKANDLPVADLRAKPECFYVARTGGGRVGIGGLETRGTDGLLRSVVVEEAARGRGYGSAICDRLEAAAREADIETLYLLTTTATAFFASRGYERVEREAAPAAIRATAEFADLCPSSATCMCLAL